MTIIQGPFKITSEGLKPLSQEGKTDLPRGTVLHLNGYNNPDFVIIGRTESGRGVTYQCINLNDYTTSGHIASHLQWLRDKQDNHIQVYITDRVMTEEEVLGVITKQKAADIERARIAEEKATETVNERTRLKSSYPYLEQAATSKKSSHALGAANIRTELKRAFPGVAFGVRSESYTGGDSIRVAWTDGPTIKEVEEVTGKYQEGYFDGMEDLYHHNHNNLWPDIYGGAKYVFEERDYSREFVQAVADKTGAKITFDSNGGWDILDDGEPWDTRHSRQTWLRRDLADTSAYTAPTPQQKTPPAPVDNKPTTTPGVTVNNFKGHPTLTLPINGNGDTFSFGLKKARAIIEHFEAIKSFVEKGSN